MTITVGEFSQLESAKTMMSSIFRSSTSEIEASTHPLFSEFELIAS